MRERLEMLAAVAALVAIIAGWWVGYVQPKDDFLEGVAACVQEHGEVGDRVLWDACYKAQPSPGGLVAVFGL